MAELALVRPAAARRLASAGVVTVADLRSTKPRRLAAQLGLGPGAARQMRRWRAALRLAAEVPEVDPRDAELLVLLHRGGARLLARENAGRLHRDLQRYAVSSAGLKRLGARPCPTRQSVSTWIAAARRRFAVEVPEALAPRRRTS